MTGSVEVPEDEDFTVFVSDAFKGGHCMEGIRTWADTNGYDFRDMMKNGLSARELSQNGDAYSDRILKMAMRKREAERKA